MINDLINNVPMYTGPTQSKKERLQHSILQLYYAAVSKKTGMLPEHVEHAVKNNRLRHDIYSIESSIDFFHEDDPIRDLFRCAINEFKRISKTKRYRIACHESGLFRPIYDNLEDAICARMDLVVRHYLAHKAANGIGHSAMAEAENTYRIVDAATGEEVAA